ncbi:o-succinylbenzoate synthase [Solibacillus sp. CAU 1738]|uniref:o-succinylbenzoate synthase n=1 Tax=Solibacillus sp. CAU 1738 TaxID=3140363 RepID=UPI0032614283
MKITKVTIYTMKMHMKSPFTTSFGTLQNKIFLLIEAKDESGLTGWGEGVAFDAPWYTEETVKTMYHMLEDFLIPMLLNKEITHPDEVSQLFAPIRRNQMAKSAIEGAVWDIYAQQRNIPLSRALGGVSDKIEVGISIGLQNTTEELLTVISGFLQEGYKRIKVKIKPGNDVELIRSIRSRFPDVPLMADANSAYTLADMETLKALDSFNLMMIEQPLACDDIVDHARLQKEIKTPICLDESITSFEDARKAVELGSCKVINIKIGRVGGITEAKKIHDYCAEKEIPVWCGGMLEAGIGRAHNIALTSLSNFVMPGDTAASNRYWEEDIIMPEVTVEDGFITVPTTVGIGYEVNRAAIEKYCIAIKHYM